MLGGGGAFQVFRDVLRKMYELEAEELAKAPFPRHNPPEHVLSKFLSNRHLRHTHGLSYVSAFHRAGRPHLDI